MTVSATYSPPQYVGNGTTTSFGFPFQFFALADLVVNLFDTTANANVSPQPVLNGSGTYDYTVTGTQDPNTGEYLAGGNIVFNNAPLGNHRVTITRKIARQQPIILTNGAQFPAKTIEGELDRVTLILQELDTALSTQVLQHPSSDPAGLIIVAPPVASRASQFAGWDASGNFGAFALPASTTAVSSAMAPVVAAASLAVAKNLLDVPFSLFAAPNATPYAVRAPQDIGTLFSSSAMGGAGVFNLPAAATAVAGAVYGFVRKTNNLTVNRAGSDVIQGIGATFTSITLAVDGDLLALESDGTNWKVISASPNVWLLLGTDRGQAYHGGGRLSFVSATQISFAPYNGQYTRIAGVSYAIPSAGITAANTGVFVNGTAGQNLAASAAYYVALFNNGGTLTPSFRAAATYGHMPDTTAGNIGVEVISLSGVPITPGETLIGMVFTNGSSQFVDSATSRDVISWFNRRSRELNTGNYGPGSTASATDIALTNSLVDFLTWGEEAPLLTNYSYGTNATSANAVVTLYIDGAAVGLAQNVLLGTSDNVPFAHAYSSTLTEGHHTAQMFMRTGAGTLTVNGVVSGSLRI